MLDPAVRDGRLDELLRKYHASRKNRVLVFVLYKKEASRVEAMLARRGWKVGPCPSLCPPVRCQPVTTQSVQHCPPFAASLGHEIHEHGELRLALHYNQRANFYTGGSHPW